MNIMKKIQIKLILTAFVVLFWSCYDEKMEWIQNPYGESITVDEIPPTIQEQINALGPLKNYSTTFPLGVGLDMELYLENEVYRNLINTNFHRITVGYHMKHGPMVNTNDGTLRFAPVDLFLQRLPADMEVHGHTLVWHQNQNGDYLRSLIAPTVIPPAATANNILDHSGLLDNSFSNWTRQNPGAGISVEAGAGMLATNSAIRLVSSSTSSSAWNLQLVSPIVPVVSGKTYTVSIFIRSNEPGRGRISFPRGHNTNQFPWMDWMNTGSATEAFTTSTNWQNVRFNLTMQDNQFQFNLDLGYLPNVTYFIDIQNLTVVDSEAQSQPTIIEKTAEEKRKAISDAMDYWITEMVTRYRHRVNAWDVVNEPIHDNATGLRFGNFQGDSGDTFHWQDFLGADYAVQAFKTARAVAKPGDLLFINDYNLEYNLNKCRRLIAYVAEIESKGAKVDGIGTQMHITVDQSMSDVAEMFRLLAQTGKLIKITELDIRVNTASPDAALLRRQAIMYHQIVQLYKEIIPLPQQYGITVWGVTDADSWIENDAPCLWDRRDRRKYAYMGFANALAGKPSGFE